MFDPFKVLRLNNTPEARRHLVKLCKTQEAQQPEEDAAAMKPPLALCNWKGNNTTSGVTNHQTKQRKIEYACHNDNNSTKYIEQLLKNRKQNKCQPKQIAAKIFSA